MSKDKKVEIKFLHDKRDVSIVNGKKIVHEEYIILGPKGLTVKFYHKEGDQSEKYIIKAVEGDKFKFISMKNDEEKKEEVFTKEDLLDEIKKHKLLKFALDFIKTQKGGAKVKSTSKKSSKKGSKSGSKKMKRGSKTKKSSKH